MSNTLPNRLRAAAQYTGLDSMRELLIEASGALESAVCRTCNSHGMIGGPSYYSPDEGGEPCPDCFPHPQERKPLTDEQIRKWWASENGLEDCDMCRLTDFTQVVRAIESAHGIKD